jgi:hypothetical protein
VIHSLGHVVYEESPEVNYRIHERNAVGIPRAKLRKAITTLVKDRSYSWKPLEQLKELNKVFENHPENSNVLEIRNWYQLVTSRSLTDRIKLSLSHKRLRSNVIDDLALRLFLLFYRGRNQKAR